VVPLHFFFLAPFEEASKKHIPRTGARAEAIGAAWMLTRLSLHWYMFLGRSVGCGRVAR
jgi:hypothetical protein